MLLDVALDHLQSLEIYFLKNKNTNIIIIHLFFIFFKSCELIEECHVQF